VIPKEIRMAVLVRAEGRCEYCQIPLDYTPDPVVIDHILPVTEGGVHSLDNLAASCSDCNGHKSAGTRGFDPQETRLAPLFHPRQDSWHEHFSWSGDGLRIIGLTAIGRATVLKLNLNRQGLLNLRAVLRLAGKHSPK
jgi:hypothetical protein